MKWTVRLKRTSFFFIIIFFGIFLSSCKNPFSQKKESFISRTFGPANQDDLTAIRQIGGPVSGSYIGASQSNNHRVEVTLGTAVSSIKVNTTQQRTVFLNFQGQEISK